ncbi:MAG TPA: NAD(P)H-hydrate dehydratase [Victivallales bacterium]|nr:NAD(P)H-hydrate dehydratase [Victivallales bacterium]
MINFLWNLEKKILFDADALNIIAKFTPSKRRYDAVLTPHEGEFKRLLSAYKISSDMDRFSLAQKLAELIGVVVVLKGPRTVIVSPGKKIYVNPTGSVALASAGTGDVLSGIIASLCAQGLDCFNASILGTFIHGRLSEISGKDFLTSDKLVELLAELKHNEIFFDNR